MAYDICMIIVLLDLVVRQGFCKYCSLDKGINMLDIGAKHTERHKGETATVIKASFAYLSYHLCMRAETA